MNTPLLRLDRVLKALADPTRLRLMTLLLTGEVCVCHLYEALEIPQSKTSRHLSYLRRAGLVQTRKRGLWVYYRLTPQDGGLIEGVLNAVHQITMTVPAVRRDLARLQKRTGCCLPAATPAVAPTAEVARRDSGSGSSPRPGIS